MFIQEFLLTVFGNLTFSIEIYEEIKYNKKQLEGSTCFQSSSSVPIHYLNNWNLSEEICFIYLSEKTLLDPEILSPSPARCSFQLW